MKRKKAKDRLILISIIFIVSISIFMIFNFWPSDPKINIEFPRDENPHPNAQWEWWYMNAHLTDKDGNGYGLMQIIYNNGLTMFILVDKTTGEHINFKSPIGQFDPNTISSPWMSWTNLGNFEYLIETNLSEVKTASKLNSRKTPLLIRGNGLTEVGANGFSYYYSLTDVDIETTIEFNDKVLDLEGKGWIDKQWGEWDFGIDFDSWQWFSIQLNDGTEIAVSDIFLDNYVVIRMFNLIDSEEKSTVINEYNIERLNNFTSQNNKLWTSEWRITANQGDFDIDLNAKISFEDQFIDPTIFEGVGTVRGTLNGNPVEGLMFSEQTYFGNLK